MIWNTRVSRLQGSLPLTLSVDFGISLNRLGEEGNGSWAPICADTWTGPPVWQILIEVSQEALHSPSEMKQSFHRRRKINTRIPHHLLYLQSEAALLSLFK